MKRLLIISALLVLVGCSDAPDKAAGMKAFIQGCKVPVSGRLVLSSGWSGNTVELNCAEFKPVADNQKGE